MNNPNTAPAPAVTLATNRGLLKVILLSLITCGIYFLWFLYSVKRDLNIIAGNHNGSRTMGMILLYILTGLTGGIAAIVWWHRISNRMGREQAYRGMPQTISAASFWGWYVLGSLIIVGPFIYLHKMCSVMNALCADYNTRG